MVLNNFLSKVPRFIKPPSYLSIRHVLAHPGIKSSQTWTEPSMASDPNLLKPPAHVSGLTTLDKSLFEKNITLPCLIVRDVKISSILPLVRNVLLKLENFKPVRTISANESHIYLNPEAVNQWADLSADTRNSLNGLSINENALELKSHVLNYDNFSLESILRAVLPSTIEGMSSFTKVGHIVHVNLRDHLLPYKDLIGQVLYEKVPNCRSVVNKVANIDNTYRNFQMEVLRGENQMITLVKENKCSFEFDFSKVYWNSRLCTEHERIVQMIHSGDVVFDVFAGVGPFSIPLAKKKCSVFANDLNPESYKWLNHNRAKNKINSLHLQTYNKDGRDFILNEIKNSLPKYLNRKVYIVMNLPALAVEFLRAFVGLYDDRDLGDVSDPPVVIVYCFAKGEDYNKIAKEMLFKNIGWDISDKVIDLFRFGTVAIKGNIHSILAAQRQRNVAMGKNKHKKTNSVFKVAGAKSLKLKAKAKAVKSELKQINVKNKTKILEMDKELMNLQETIRNTTSEKPETVKSNSKLPSQATGSSAETRQQSQETLDQLNAMQL